MSVRLTSLAARRAVAAKSIPQLASLTNISEFWLNRCEQGNSVTNDEAKRLSDTLGDSLTTLGKQDDTSH